MSSIENCICSGTFDVEAFSENFDVRICRECRSQSFVSANSDGGSVDFLYNADSEKYSEPDYLFGSELRWAHIQLLELGSFWKGKKVLEVGCFNGFFLAELRALGAEVYGVEPNEKAVEVASRLNGLSGLIYRSVGEVRDRGPFDVVLGVDVVEHVPDPRGLVHELASILKANATLIIAGPVVERRFFDKSDFPPHHLWRFSIAGLESMLCNESMEVTRVSCQSDPVLLIRNLVGRLIYGYGRKEFYGDSGLKLIRPQRNMYKAIYSAISLLGGKIFNFFSITYCSAIVFATKSSCKVDCGE